MKILSIFFLFLSALHAQVFDAEAEEQIVNQINQKEFSNSLVNYRYNNSTFPIQIVHNPNLDFLWSNQFENPVNDLSIIIVGDLPLDLVWHLESVVTKLSADQKIFMDLRGRSYLKTASSLRPIYVAKQIDDPISDAQVKEIFSSTEFVSQVLHYHLDGIFYKVRILHNPQENSYTSTKKFRLDGELTEYTYTWNYKYGILTDVAAPRELIDHLSSFVNCSYWDWFLNFIASNGTYVEYTTRHYSYDLIYSLDTVYDFTENLR